MEMQLNGLTIGRISKLCLLMFGHYCVVYNYNRCHNVKTNAIVKKAEK